MEVCHVGNCWIELDEMEWYFVRSYRAKSRYRLASISSVPGLIVTNL